MARLAAVCLLAAAACCLLRSLAFVPAPATRSDALTTATGAAVIATIPAGADAFVYKGKEYFDVFYGIEPLAWAFCGFCIVYYGAVLKNAAQKYNIPPAPQPPKVGGFVGKEVENSEPSYMDSSIKQGPY
ncbi:unnamed protein product [Symbiodinium sp. CCMP2592]|nr:unnamed protein product [Symbiodinium sp. CCMP2592]CAE7368535.1 unnamed protein product [Symbiodinium sp. CCMP2592]CAE7368546.1 unnamed protein product [Symbiodinium sp. CCMP2592]CAE7368557.1 unnamed protein product [Symbiodinium sp. CCMP2592]